VTAACRLTTADPCHPGATIPARDVDVTRHQQEFPDSRPIPVLPLACDRHGWDGGPWAFPWASHPTDQEPATHATVGTRSNTNPELRLRHTSSLLHELTHNVRLRVATTSIGRTRASQAPGHCIRCPRRSPTRTRSPSWTYDGINDSAESSTSTNMRLELRGWSFRQGQRPTSTPLRSGWTDQRVQSRCVDGRRNPSSAAETDHPHPTRWVGSVRRELLDRILIVNAAHLRTVLTEYEDHLNAYRPHRALNQAGPLRPLPDPVDADIKVIRRDRLGGLLHEYSQAA
jgi:hypothetical protein